MRIPTFLLFITVCAAPAAADNAISNGDFESGAAIAWRGGVLDREVVHAGRGALRLDEPAGKASVSARYEPGVELQQDQPAPIMAAAWLRFDARRQTGSLRGGVTFRVEMVDGRTMSWYGPFEIEPDAMGAWIYHEARWVPPAAVVKIQPSLYLKGCEGAVWVDDLYLGPAADLPSVPRSTVPLAVTGSDGRFTDCPRVELQAFRPVAHVFHLGPKANQANLELSCTVDVQRTAPAYLTSAWGSQYWTLYCPQRTEIVQIYTDERLDLSRPGRQTLPVKMCGFSEGASELGPGGYVFVTDMHKNFLIYGTEHPAGPPAAEGQPKSTAKYWDTVKVEQLSRHLGPSGVTAPFSLADLSQYKLSATAEARQARLVVRPVLVDAHGDRVPLYGLQLQAAVEGKTLALEAEQDPDGVPMGSYGVRLPGPAAKSVRVTGPVRLAAPQGIQEVPFDQTVEVATPPAVPAAESARLSLSGWGSPSYELSPHASQGPQSMARLVADAQAAGVSKLLVHARTSEETLYPSRIALASTVGEWDVLAAAVAEGKRQGVGVYAAYILGIAQPADLEAHPDWSALDRRQKTTGWYCYTNPEVRAFHAALLAEIVERYDVAGVSLDYCRPGGGCFCPRCQKGFEQRFGKPLLTVDTYDADWRCWQREQITEYLRQLRQAVRQARPTAQLSGYVWARFAPDKDRALQDWPRWLREGIYDFVAVGQYTPSTPVFRAECHALQTIAQRELNGDLRQICPLLGVSYIQKAYPSYLAGDAVIARHLQAVQETGLTAAGYFPFYSIRTHLATSAAFSTAPAGR